MTWAEVKDQIFQLLTLPYDGTNDISRLRQAFTLIINQINAGSTEPENVNMWDPDTNYALDAPAFWRDEWVASNSANNLGNEPISSGGVLSLEWRIVSVSPGTGIIEYQQQIYPRSLEIVLYSNKLYYLDRSVVGAAPYNSVDIVAEIMAGNWKTFFGDYYKGLYTSKTALDAAHPAGSPGDYADVDAGPGEDVERYIWDDDDDVWVLGSGAGLSSGPNLLAAIDAAVGNTTWRMFDPTTKADVSAVNGLFDEVSVALSGSNITLDCNSKRQAVFQNTAAHTTNYNIIKSNDGDTRLISYMFETSGTVIITLESDDFMGDNQQGWNNAVKQLTINKNGIYELVARKRGSNYYWTLSDSF